MSWTSACELVEPVLDQLLTGTTSYEMQEHIAESVAVTLIKKCQADEWDTESETLEKYAHVPWIVRAFGRCGVIQSTRTKADVQKLVRSIIDGNVDNWHDLSESFARNVHAEAIAEAIFPYLKTGN